MDFGFSEDQEMLRGAVKDFLDKECPTTFVRRMSEDERGYSPEMWRQMAELGWMGLTIPEEYGGLGLGFLEMTVTLEEMGAALLPGPYFPTTILAAPLILALGSEDQKENYLPRIVAGELTGTLALVEASGRWDAEGVAATARAEGEGFVLSGSKLFVPEATNADLFVWAARTGGSGEDGVTLFLVERGAPGVKVERMVTMDLVGRLGEVTLENVRVGKDAVLGPVGGGWPALKKVMDQACVAHAIEMIGISQRTLDVAVEYAKSRVQFGVPIGSFQAVKHIAADMKVAVENMRSIAYYAAWVVSEDRPELPLTASMAKAYCSDAGRQVTGSGIQIHGGIGFTWDSDMHLYFKRAFAVANAFGDAIYHRERVTSLIEAGMEATAGAVSG
jgi:alkylation response protein AidB-like acyl-CoA dehydrogenase